MATITNSNLFKELKDGARIQQLTDVVPTQLGKEVIPVMEVNPKLLRVANIVRTGNAANATSGNVYVTPADKDFYLTACSLSVIKDGTATSVLSAICVTVDGTTATTGRIIVISGITLTANAQTATLNFAVPIKIDRGSTITVTNTTNVGNIRADACIVGYLVENINA